jgi:competence protein ComEA
VLDIHHRRRDALLAVVLVLALLLVLGKLLTRAGTPHATAPAVRPVAATRPAAAAVVVDVVGAVQRPGLYRMRTGDRVADAVTRAGGATGRADLEQINLAAPLADGQQVVVPRRGTGAPGAGASTSSGPVHLSTATVEQLDALPGVGPVTAQKIVDYRQQHGGFHSLEELDAIPGIGPARIEQLKGLVTP